MGLIEAMNSLIINSNAEVKVGSRREQAQRLSELQDDPEVSSSTSPCVSGGRRRSQLSSLSLNSGSSGDKRSWRFVKLCVPVLGVAFACYLAHEYVVDGVKVSIDHPEQMLNSDRKGYLSDTNDHGRQSSYRIEEKVDNPVNLGQEERILRHDWKYRAADGCLKDGEVQVDICLAGVQSSDVAVNCCAGSIEKNNLQCSRDGCVQRSTFAAAEQYCEAQGMRLCSVAELESGACCAQGCNWNKKISWTSDRCETSVPSISPSNQPSPSPSTHPTSSPSSSPSNKPTPLPTSKPSRHPTPPPSSQPTSHPSSSPSNRPSSPPTSKPTRRPSPSPTNHPSPQPTKQPSFPPSPQPTRNPTPSPTRRPSPSPTNHPSPQPTKQPSFPPSPQPTRNPTPSPTRRPSPSPSNHPSPQPTKQPSFPPSPQPTRNPTPSPTRRPSPSPSNHPSPQPTKQPSFPPSSQPTRNPTPSPTNHPSISMNEKEVGGGSFVEQMYRVVDGCVSKGSQVQNDICLASEHSSDVAVHCCRGSMETKNLKCSRDGCKTRSTFAAAEQYCEEQGMRLCSVAELESGACCDKGCGWNWKISWTSDSCEASSLSSSSSNQSASRPKPTIRPTPSPSNQPSPLPTTLQTRSPTPSPTNHPSISMNVKEVGGGSFVEQMYRVADGCVNKGSQVQNDTCLASEHSSDVAVHCCRGSKEEKNLKCSRDKCVKRSTFAAAEQYCEEQGMRLCSVAELESGACCDKGCGWNFQISWTSDSCEASSLSSSSSNQPPSPPSNQPPSLPTRPALRSSSPSSSSSQPTTIMSSLSISSNSSSTFITSEAMANPPFGTSFGLWEILSLTLVGVLLCFAALGYHIVRKKRNNKNQKSWAEERLDRLEKRLEEKVDRWLSWPSPFLPFKLWPSEDSLDESSASAEAEEEEAPEETEALEEEEVPGEKGDGWLPWQSPSHAVDEEVPEEEEGSRTSWQLPFRQRGDSQDQLSDEGTNSHSSTSSGYSEEAGSISSTSSSLASGKLWGILSE